MKKYHHEMMLSNEWHSFKYKGGKSHKNVLKE